MTGGTDKAAAAAAAADAKDKTVAGQGGADAALQGGQHGYASEPQEHQHEHHHRKHLLVRTASGKHEVGDIKFNDTDMVDKIKDKIHHRVGVPVSHVRLYAQDDELVEGHQMQEYHLQNEEEVYFATGKSRKKRRTQHRKDDHGAHGEDMPTTPEPPSTPEPEQGAAEDC
eukprot:TRINITY_DN27673_c0_g1_i1.p1 TRINITY_DN27673_c0_g1~~TRINITY_DN27673_c0_g1_i1.p1  ORF type:complete len:170 (+),score=53.59 TRINITY_DN27673_c0_g1_i1:145-654(+)